MNITSVYSLIILALAVMFAYAAVNETRFKSGNRLIAATLGFTAVLCVAVVAAAYFVVPS